MDNSNVEVLEQPPTYVWDGLSTHRVEVLIAGLVRVTNLRTGEVRVARAS